MTLVLGEDLSPHVLSNTLRGRVIPGTGGSEPWPLGDDLVTEGPVR